MSPRVDIHDERLYSSDRTLPFAAELSDHVFRGEVEINLRGRQSVMAEDILQGSGGDAFCQNYFPEYPLTYL
jgi:hypothetical protein